VLVRRGTSEASVPVRMDGVTARPKGDGGWTEEGDGGHLAERLGIPARARRNGEVLIRHWG
jgi:hypothetical protein